MSFLLKFRSTSIRSQDDDGIIWLDPASVDLFCGSKWPHYHVSRSFWRRRFLELNPRFSFLSLEGEWDLYSRPITQKRTYQRLDDLVRNIDTYWDSVWFNELLHACRRDGFAVHKQFRMNYIEDIDRFFLNYVRPLVHSMCERGYIHRSGDDVGAVVIDREGVIQKAGSGNHRFCLAKILGVKLVPVQVTFVHSDWLRREKLTVRPSDQRALLDRITKIARGIRTGIDGRP